MKKIRDLKGNVLLLFVHEWSIRMVQERNKGVARLSEFGTGGLKKKLSNMKPSNVRELLLSNNNYRDFERLAGIRDSVLANLSTILTVSGKSYVVKHKNNLENGPIGTMSESILHHCLKNYVDENVDNHRVFIENYFADIQNGNEITEIQTKSLYKLKPELNAFLENYDVCVVYPLIRNKWIRYMDVKDVKSGSFDFETFKRRKNQKISTEMQHLRCI